MSGHEKPSHRFVVKESDDEKASWKEIGAGWTLASGQRKCPHRNR